MVYSIVGKLIEALTPTIPNATGVLALIPQMTEDETAIAMTFVEKVIQDTSLFDLTEKDALAYMKIYLKCRKAPEVNLEDTLDETQLTRLSQLTQ